MGKGRKPAGDEAEPQTIRKNMAIENVTTIDIISKPNAEGKVWLIITDAGLTTDPDTRFELLAKKLQGYANAVLNGELAMECPDQKPGDFSIRVVCALPPTEAMLKITSVGQSANQIPVFFGVWNPGNPNAAEVPSPAGATTASEPTPSYFPWRLAFLIALPVIAGAGYFGYQHLQLNNLGTAGRPENPAGQTTGLQSAPVTAPAPTVSKVAVAAVPLVRAAPVISAAPKVPTTPWISDVTVVSATFGRGQIVVDVTARVIELLRTQPDGFFPNNKTLEANPATRRKKQLTIQYRYQGANYTFVCGVGQSVNHQTLVGNALKKP
jgi:hypothetical protein